MSTARDAFAKIGLDLAVATLASAGEFAAKMRAVDAEAGVQAEAIVGDIEKYTQMFTSGVLDERSYRLAVSEAGGALENLAWAQSNTERLLAIESAQKWLKILKDTALFAVTVGVSLAVPALAGAVAGIAERAKERA